MGQNDIYQFLTRAHDISCLPFTDGLCLGNPGPCGPGAVDYLPDDQMGIYLTRPVALFLSFFLSYWLRSILSITPGSANFEILIKK